MRHVWKHFLSTFARLRRQASGRIVIKDVTNRLTASQWYTRSSVEFSSPIAPELRSGSQ